MKRTMQLLSILVLVVMAFSAIAFGASPAEMGESPPITSTDTITFLAPDFDHVSPAEERTITFALDECGNITGILLDRSALERATHPYAPVLGRTPVVDYEQRIASPYRQPTRAVSRHALDL